MCECVSHSRDFYFGFSLFRLHCYEVTCLGTSWTTFHFVSPYTFYMTVIYSLVDDFIDWLSKYMSSHLFTQLSICPSVDLSVNSSHLFIYSIYLSAIFTDWGSFMHSRPNNRYALVQSKAAFKNRGSLLRIFNAGHFLHDFLKRALTEDLTYEKMMARQPGLERKTWQKRATTTLEIAQLHLWKSIYVNWSENALANTKNDNWSYLDRKQPERAWPAVGGTYSV